MNENENTTTQNLWDTVKAVLRERFIAKQEKSQINNLTLQLKQLEKEELENSRVSRRKEIMFKKMRNNLENNSRNSCLFCMLEHFV